MLVRSMYVLRSWFVAREIPIEQAERTTTRLCWKSLHSCYTGSPRQLCRKPRIPDGAARRCEFRCSWPALLSWYQQAPQPTPPSVRPAGDTHLHRFSSTTDWKSDLSTKYIWYRFVLNIDSSIEYRTLLSMVGGNRTNRAWELRYFM